MAQDEVTVNLQGNTVTSSVVDVSASTIPASTVSVDGLAQCPRKTSGSVGFGSVLIPMCPYTTPG